MNTIANKVMDIAKELFIVEYNVRTNKFRWRVMSATFRENFSDAIDRREPVWAPLAYAEDPKRAEFITTQLQRILNHEGIDKEAEDLLRAYQYRQDKLGNSEPRSILNS